LLFFQKLSASVLSFSAEILGPRRFGDTKNSQLPRCFPLFLFTHGWGAKIGSDGSSMMLMP
jgi:hypothetical protein